MRDWVRGREAILAGLSQEWNGLAPPMAGDFRVEAIRCGNYLTADGEPFEVTPAAPKHWADTFKQFKGWKIPAPVPSGTDFQVDGEHNRGRIGYRGWFSCTSLCLTICGSYARTRRPKYPSSLIPHLSSLILPWPALNSSLPAARRDAANY